MKLEQSFEVDAPLERVWQTLIDVEHVAPCLPGAAVTGRNEDGSYNGTFTVKIGPTTASYTGRLEMENVDEVSHTATMQAQGTDKRGQGGAKATIFSRLAPADGRGTRVEVVTDYHITGRLARFGRGGMIEDISERLLREFAKRLQSSLAAQPESAAVAQPVSPAEAAPAGYSEAAPAAGYAAAPAGMGSSASDGVVSSEPTGVESSEPSPARDETIFAPSLTNQETRVSQTQAPPAWEPPVVPAPADPASGPPSGPVAGEPAGPGAGPGPAGTGPGAPADEPAPPPPPSPGPPPVVTPPPPATPPPPPGAQADPGLQHPPHPSEPLQGLSLVGGVMWGRVKRNPAPAAAAGVAVMLLLARRRRRRRNAWG